MDLDLRRRRGEAADGEHVVTQSVQVAGDGSSQSLQVAGGGGSSQSAPVAGGGTQQDASASAAAGLKTAEEMLDKMLEDLNKEKERSAVARFQSGPLRMPELVLHLGFRRSSEGG